MATLSQTYFILPRKTLLYKHFIDALQQENHLQPQLEYIQLLPIWCDCSTKSAKYTSATQFKTLCLLRRVTPSVFEGQRQPNGEWYLPRVSLCKLFGGIIANPRRERHGASHGFVSQFRMACWIVECQNCWILHRDQQVTSRNLRKLRMIKLFTVFEQKRRMGFGYICYYHTFYTISM